MSEQTTQDDVEVVAANIYSHPEQHGLTQYGEVEFAGGYEFDLLVVWRDAEGRFYYADDSGCSCPVPFELIRRADITAATRDEVAAHIKHRLRNTYSSSGNGAALDLLERLGGEPA